MAVAKLGIKVIIEPDEPGFHTYCPAFKGLHTDGMTKEEALENAKEAIMVYLESLLNMTLTSNEVEWL